MGLIPKVDQPVPAFIHIDVDDLWAIAECYGIHMDSQWAHHVSQDALPRFRRLFQKLNIKATFFLVGRDLQSPAYVELIQSLLSGGHRVANHSFSHRLDFRSLDSNQIAEEIDQCHSLAQSRLGVVMRGFRAPGYAWSRGLRSALSSRGYHYDASIMPSPYGPVFRRMDNRLRKKHNNSHQTPKTQYPLISDTWRSLYPTPLGGSPLVEIPSAASGLLRLPFQAGVCMRLGYPYFRACLQPYKINRALPFIFLFHAADLTDFSNVPGDFFQHSSFFNKPIAERENLAEKFLIAITQFRKIITTEDWLEYPDHSPSA